MTVTSKRIGKFEGWTSLEDLRKFVMFTCADLDGECWVQIHQEPAPSGGMGGLRHPVTEITVHEQCE